MAGFFKMMLSAVALVASASVAADVKQPPVRLLVGFSPGGTTDVVARVLAENLRGKLKRDVIVENKPGAIGRLAAQTLLTSPKDGSVYLFGPDSWAIFPNLMLTNAELRYDYQKDFTPVAKVVAYPMGLYAGSKSGIKNLNDFVTKLKSDPKYAMYATSGLGGIGEYLGVALSQSFQTTLTTVPYKGAAGVKNAILGDETSTGIMAPGDLSELVRNGLIVPLGMMSKQRWSAMPEVPTMREQGYDVTQGEAFMAVWAASKTDPDEVKKMEEAIRLVVADTDFQEKMQRAAVNAEFSSSQELRQEINQLLDYWRPLVANQKQVANK